MTGQLARLRETPLLESPCRPVSLPKPRMLCATAASRHSPGVVARAAAMASELGATLASLQVTGDYLPAIAAAAEESGVDLVILDSNPWKPILSPIAATAGELAAQVRRPALIVKRSARAPYESVLIAADPSEAFDEVLRRLSSWRLLERECVAIIHGFESHYRGPLYAAGLGSYAARRNTEEWELAARRRLLRGLDPLGPESGRVRVIFVPSRPVREIRREVRRVRPDLLVIATAHHAAVDRVMRASVGNDLLRNLECDILALPMMHS